MLEVGSAAEGAVLTGKEKNEKGKGENWRKKEKHRDSITAGRKSGTSGRQNLPARHKRKNKERGEGEEVKEG